LFPGFSAFFATGVTVLNDSTHSIAFPYIGVNEGGDYNQISGKFTCRIPGLYWISAGIGKNIGANVSYIFCDVTINGQSFGNRELGLYADAEHDDKSGYTSSASGAFHLQTNDQVYVTHCTGQEHFYSGPSTFFSGTLIRPDV